jgi:AAA+ superfamily predicted ATPase
MIISGINKNIFLDHNKNIILHGESGTGKSCLAQAIAITSRTPCLFLNAWSLSTGDAKLDEHNLNKIFEYTKSIEKEHGKCIVILDGLEALIKQHVGNDAPENNIFKRFWQELDNRNNSRVMFISTMNSTEGLPEQIVSRTSMVNIPLPTEKGRHEVLSYHLKAEKDNYNLTYPSWIECTFLARQTKGFSHIELENVVLRATRPFIILDDNKTVTNIHFDNAIKEIKNNKRRRLKTKLGTWIHAGKAQLFTRKSIGLTLVAAGIFYTYKGIEIQRENIALQKAAMDQRNRIANRAAKLAFLEHQRRFNWYPEEKPF